MVNTSKDRNFIDNFSLSVLDVFEVLLEDYFYSSRSPCLLMDTQPHVAISTFSYDFSYDVIFLDVLLGVKTDEVLYFDVE